MGIMKSPWLLSFLIVFLLLTQAGFAGITGKISGRIVDSETGEALPAANIVIVGTTMGAASDQKGDFTILNVPPGIYNLRATVIGYAALTIQDVRVRIDQTSGVDFKLTLEALEGETITVVAPKKPIRKDVSTSVAALSNDEVVTQPMSHVEDVVGLQAGVESGLVIRGGGAEETLFQLDGVTMRDPRNNMPITNIAITSIQEVSVERGGFNAEYGQVRSGIINIVTKEGEANQYQGNIILRYSPPGAKYFGDSPFDANATLLRPYLDPSVAWEGTQNSEWDAYTRRQYPDFEGWNAVSRRLLSDSDPTNDLSPAAAQQLFRWQHRRQAETDQPDYNVDASLGGPVPLVGKKLGNLRFYSSFRTEREMLVVPLSRPDYQDYYGSLKLNSSISPALKLTISSMFGKSFHVTQNEAGLDQSTQYIRSADQVAYQISNMDYPRATDSRLFCDSYFAVADVGFRTFAAKLTHILSQNTYYDASLEHIYRKYNAGPIQRRDFSLTEEFAPGKFTDEAPFGFSPIDEAGVDGMMTGGHTSTARDSSQISATTLKVDLSSQITHQNLIKAGVELVYGDLDLNYGEAKELYVEGNRFVKMHKFPLRGAIYLQNKLELQGLIVNAGLRLDYSDANTDWADVNQWDKDFFSSNYTRGLEIPIKAAESQISFSPRLGISHPISENSKLFFNYGHFKQLPTYEQLFRLSRGGSNEVQGIGDPNLEMEKTIAYELGYDHSLVDIYLIQLSAFYRDITNQRDYTTYLSADASVSYQKATNNLYEDIRGFEFTLRKTVGRWWLGMLNYTYQVNTLGHFGKTEIYQDPKSQREYDRNTRQLYQERPIPQPYARAKVSFFSPKDYGPQVLHVQPLANWNFNIITDWRAGRWVTWNPSQQVNVAQNVQSRDWFNIDLRLMKHFDFSRFELNFFIDIYNALNTRRLSLNSFYDSHDYNYYFQSLHLPKSDDYRNIVGDDKVGDFRKDGVEFQPIENVGNVQSLTPDVINARAIYYDQATERYLNYRDGAWKKVDAGRMDQILKDKAYIDMPNHTYFNFLNPRDIFFGFQLNFKID